MEKVKDKLYGFAAEYSISRAEFDKIAPDHPNKKLNGIEECFDMLVAISEITGHDNMAGMIRKMDYKKLAIWGGVLDTRIANMILYTGAGK